MNYTTGYFIKEFNFEEIFIVTNLINEFVSF
jgi:hypothetical protein